MRTACAQPVLVATCATRKKVDATAAIGKRRRIRRDRAVRSNSSAPSATRETCTPLEEQPPELSSSEAAPSSTHVPSSQRKPFRQSALVSHVSRPPPPVLPLPPP